MEKRNSEGFLQHYNNILVDKIQYKFDGSCTICFKDGSMASHFIGCEVVYNEQFGIPVSPDGKLLFVSNWENGLTAYDTVTGEKKWQYRRSRIGPVFVYSDFLITRRYGISLLKLDSFSGELLWELRSGTIERIYSVDNKYLFLDRLRGKYSVVDIETTKVYKIYPNKLANPLNCLSHLVLGVHLQDNRLYIKCREAHPNRNCYDEQSGDVDRVIDSAFLDNNIRHI